MSRWFALKTSLCVTEKEPINEAFCPPATLVVTVSTVCTGIRNLEEIQQLQQVHRMYGYTWYDRWRITVGWRSRWRAELRWRFIFSCYPRLPAHLCSSAHLSHISLVSTALLPASLLLRLIPLVSSARTDACVVPSLFAGFCPRVSPVSPACHALPFPGGSESLCFFCYFPPQLAFCCQILSPAYCSQFLDFSSLQLAVFFFFSPCLPPCLAVESLCLNRDMRRITGLITRLHKTVKVWDLSRLIDIVCGVFFKSSQCSAFLLCSSPN